MNKGFMLLVLRGLALIIDLVADLKPHQFYTGVSIYMKDVEKFAKEYLE